MLPEVMDIDGVAAISTPERLRARGDFTYQDVEAWLRNRDPNELNSSFSGNKVLNTGTEAHR